MCEPFLIIYSIAWSNGIEYEVVVRCCGGFPTNGGRQSVEGRDCAKQKSTYDRVPRRSSFKGSRGLLVG